MKSVLVKRPAKRAVCESHRGAETIAVVDISFDVGSCQETGPITHNSGSGC